MTNPRAPRGRGSGCPSRGAGGRPPGGELAGGGEDEGAGPSRGLLHEALEDREEEGGGLAGAGLGGADDVPPDEDRGDRLPLDRRWSFVADRVDGPHEGGVEAEVVEGAFVLHCRWYDLGAIRLAFLHRGPIVLL